MTKEDKKPYYEILVASWKIFLTDRKEKEFSDEWWTNIIEEFEQLRQKYIGTKYLSYCEKLNQTFLDECEEEQKHDRQGRVPKDVLPGAQRAEEKELQRSDAVRSVG